MDFENREPTTESISRCDTPQRHFPGELKRETSMVHEDQPKSRKWWSRGVSRATVSSTPDFDAMRHMVTVTTRHLTVLRRKSRPKKR
ncbi:hypothetical protein ANTPLA_LOCUS7086 [Anthophora plagiata]